MRDDRYLRRYDALSPNDRRVLFYLNDLADAEGIRTISAYVKDIALAIGSSPRRVQASLSRLEESGYIMRQPVKTSRGANEASRFTIINSDKSRMDKIKLASEVSGISIERMVEYVYWLNFHKDKLKQALYPTVGLIANLSHCPVENAADFVRGIATARILVSDREVSF